MDESNELDEAEQQALIRREMGRRGIYRLLLMLGLILLFAIGGLLNALSPSGPIMSLATCTLLPLAVIFLLGFYIIWRCSSCETSLGRRADPDFCPYCGAQLRFPKA